MWAESWAPGSNRELAAKYSRPSSFSFLHQEQWLSPAYIWGQQAGPMPLVFLPQRSGADCDLTAPAAIPAHRAFGSMSHELGRLVGRIVLSVPTHSLHWHPCFVCPQVA